MIHISTLEGSRAMSRASEAQRRAGALSIFSAAAGEAREARAPSREAKYAWRLSADSPRSVRSIWEFQRRSRRLAVPLLVSRPG